MVKCPYVGDYKVMEGWLCCGVAENRNGGEEGGDGGREGEGSEEVRERVLNYLEISRQHVDFHCIWDSVLNIFGKR